MFSKVLIANRGEIACRVIKTAKKLGIKSIAVYSDADAQALHVKLADEAYRLGPAPSQESYLNVEKILEIARLSKAEAIHPGYGFLAENPDFAELCEKQGVIFIGPPSQAIRAMGSKSAAKKWADQANVPLIPGYYGTQQDPELLYQYAKNIGFPLLIKAVMGGGGKGMRVVQNETDFMPSLLAAKREALKSFGDDQVLLESYLKEARHIEIQIFADQHQQCVSLFERDCSIQRRHQKILEEAPAPNISEELRENMGKCAINLAKAIHYVGAGTLEFLVADSQFYFMEMNTRLQVEHPITEKITGIDLVEWQFKVAAGEPLSGEILHPQIHGHSIEARICAENPDQDFLPSIGKIECFMEPEEHDSLRLDTGIQQGDEISPYYDSMLAKLIVWGETREVALNKIKNALREFFIVGLKTNIPFLYRIVGSLPYKNVKLNTHFISTWNNEYLTGVSQLPAEVKLAAIALILIENKRKFQESLFNADPYSPWLLSDGWRGFGKNSIYVFLEEIQLNYSVKEEITFAKWDSKVNQMEFSLINEEKVDYKFLVKNLNHYILYKNDEILSEFPIFIGPKNYAIGYQGEVYLFKSPFVCERSHVIDNGNEIKAPMPGTIVALHVEVGQEVETDAPLVILEAMKMEHTLKASQNSKVVAIHHAVGDFVMEGTELVELIPMDKVT